MSLGRNQLSVMEVYLVNTTYRKLTVIIFHTIREELLRHCECTSREVRVICHPFPHLNPSRRVTIASQDREDVILE